jgi:N-acetylglucosamine-6-phosphate deacetylase
MLRVTTSLLLRAGQVLLDGALVTDIDVLIRDGLIAQVGVGLPAPSGTPVVDAPDGVLAPGLVDLHVHALDGAGMVGPGAPDIAGLSLALARRGVTGFLATTAAAPVDELIGVLEGPRETEGARCLGVHLEGPWLSVDCAGAQPIEYLTLPGIQALELLLAAGPPAMLTLAPELDGATEVITRAVAAGVVVSLGHSATTYDGAVAATRLGARHITHCFNAMSGLHHREPGLAGAALDLPEVTVELIADGVHVHPAVARLAMRAAGDRICLVSDAVDVALPGTAAAELADGTLAGSRIGLDGAIRNLVEWGIPLADALTAASVTPASVLGLRHQITLGAPADLVLLDADLEVRSTYVGGAAVWTR